MSVDTVFLHRHTEHLRSRRAIDIAAVLENIKPPLFSRQPRQHSCLDCRKVGHYEFHSRFRHECRADKLRERVGNVIVEHFHSGIISAFHKFPSLFKVGNMVLREVLQLNEPPRPTTAAVCTVELEHSVRPSVRAYSVFHRLIFLYRGFRKLLTEFKYLRKLWRCGFQH